MTLEHYTIAGYVLVALLLWGYAIRIWLVGRNLRNK